jgi:hypothetical protein
MTAPSSIDSAHFLHGQLAQASPERMVSGTDACCIARAEGPGSATRSARSR